MKRLVLIGAGIISVLSCFTACQSPPQQTSILESVDPYIGTDDHGHVFLGASVPFGAVKVGPDNYNKGWDWCSGYHYSDSIIRGFSQLHLSGTGIGDLGDILITPYTGEIKTTPGTIEDPLAGYASLFSHDEESARPGYYAVKLKNYAIKVELTASERVAFHRYTFPAHRESHVAINLGEGIGWDSPVDTYLEQVDDTTFTGYRYSTGWAKDQRVYFSIRTSIPISDFTLYNPGKVQGAEASGERVTGILNFETAADEAIMLKVGISPVSEKNALQNLEVEVPGWDFEAMVEHANGRWEEELGRIRVRSKNPKDLRTFYTALYHSFLMPSLFSDQNGEFRGADSLTYSSEGDTYSVFSLWDTYRAAHPLYTLVQPARVTDFVNSMLDIYMKQGKLPVWHLMGNETDCMVGYSAIPVVADAYFKGIGGFDAELAYEAMKVSSTRDEFGLDLLKEKGYIPADLEKESVSKALEYALSDWCIAQVAKDLGYEDDYRYYLKRSKGYEKYFDTASCFMRAKLNNGTFRAPFDPFNSIHQQGDYTEGNAWQYTWLVPHDVEGLIGLFKDEQHFSEKLDSLFVVEGELGEHASADISGLIGQYAHGNEPCHHVIYLYAFVGEQWKTASLSRRIQQELYNDQPDGLCGNEDCGQMSAWYILSSMGFYQVNPANGIFVFGSPRFDEVTLDVGKGKEFKIVAHQNSSENSYIQSALLNGNELSRSYISYPEIMNGGVLEFEMGASPNPEFGLSDADRPKSKIYSE